MIRHVAARFVSGLRMRTPLAASRWATAITPFAKPQAADLPVTERTISADYLSKPSFLAIDSIRSMTRLE